MLSAFASAFKMPELCKKIFFTLGTLPVPHLGSTIPVSNVNMRALDICLNKATGGRQAGLYSLINLFSDNTLLHLTIFALGVMPYITSSIILQLPTVVIPRLEALHKEGAVGRAKITQHMRYLTLVLVLLQVTTFVTMARTDQLLPDCKDIGILHKKAELFPLVTVVPTMTAGTVVIMWLGELITGRGVGNSMSVLIFTQIAVQFPTGLRSIKEGHQGATDWFLFLAIIAIGLFVMFGILFMEQGQRRVPVQYTKRAVGRRLASGSTTYIPLKINQSGVILMILVNSILYLPVLYTASRSQSGTGQWVIINFHTNSWVHGTLQFLFIVGFCYFYITITFSSEEVSGNMKKYGGLIPSICAGKPAKRYLTHVLNYLTASGSLYLAIISMILTLAFIVVGMNQDFPFGGTSILIIAGVALDMTKHIESQLQQRNYEGLLK